MNHPEVLAHLARLQAITLLRGQVEGLFGARRGLLVVTQCQHDQAQELEGKHLVDEVHQLSGFGQGCFEDRPCRFQLVQ